MKVELGQGEYIEIVQDKGKVVLAIASRHATKPKAIVVTSAEISLTQFNQLISNILQEKEK